MPLWIRKILLRGLRVNADERFPSMEELLEALGQEPGRRAAAVVGGDERACCSRWASASACGRGWPIRSPRAAAGPRSWPASGSWCRRATARRRARRSFTTAFLKTGKSYAKDVWATTSRALTNYARAWTDMYKETCEATAVNKVQSTEVMDLRMDCLNERLGGLRALTDVFADANGEVVENAVSAANALASLDRCADVPLLRAVVQTARGLQHTRAKVDDLRKRLAEVKAQIRRGALHGTLKKAPALVDEARSSVISPFWPKRSLSLGRSRTSPMTPRQREAAFVRSFLTAMLTA